MFLIQIAFESSEYSLMFGPGFVNRIHLNVKSQGTKKSRFLQKVQEQADDSKNLRRETLYISVYECVNISTFALLDVKLWLEEDENVNTHHPYIHSYLFSRGLKINT